MDVADRIAVLHNGRIEQVGSPQDLYDRPANGFVMSFLGPVATVNGSLVRPHDLRIQRERSAEAVAARVERVVHLGFEVRVDLHAVDGGAAMSAQLTRETAATLGLRSGETVAVIPVRRSELTDLPVPAAVA